MTALERALGQAGERGGEAAGVRGDAVAGAAEQEVGVARVAQREPQPCARGVVADQVVERVGGAHRPSALRTRAAMSSVSPVPATRSSRPLPVVSTSS